LDSNGKKFDINLYIKRFPGLKEFITRNELKFEIEILRAVQKMDYKLKHIPGFICVLFEIFYTEGIVSEETFWKWKDDDPMQDGHIISVYILKEFFELLSELNKHLENNVFS